MSEQINKVLYNIDQTADTTEDQKAQARANIGVEALPDKTGNANKVLSVNAQATGLEWVPQSGGGSQVQANWTETDNTDPSYIQNKPSIPSISLLHHTQQVSITAGQYVTPETYNLTAYIPANSKFYGSLTIERLSNLSTSGAYHFVLAVPNNSMTCNFGDYPAARQSGHNINFFVDNSASDSQYQLYFQLSGQFEDQNITVHVDGIVFN